MAKVDTENGFVSIANQLWDAIIQHDFTGQEHRVLGALIRLTYGFNKKSSRFSGAIASETTGIHQRNCNRVLKRLETSEVVICYKRAAGPKSGVYGPNKDFDQWKIDRLSTKSIPSLHRFLQINEIEGCENTPLNGSNQPGKDDVLLDKNTHLDGSNQPALLDKALSIKLDKALSSKEEGLLDKKRRLAGQKTPSSWTKLCLASTPANAVVEGIVRPREDKEDKEDSNIPPPPPVNHSDKNRKVEVEEIDEFPTNVVSLNLTVEQSWKNSRSRFRNEAQTMLSRKLSFGGLPLWATQDLDKVIDANPPQDWTPKRWFTLLRDLLSAAVFEAEQAWIKSQSSVRSGLRLCLSRWKTSVAVATSGIPQAQSSVQA